MGATQPSIPGRDYQGHRLKPVLAVTRRLRRSRELEHGEQRAADRRSGEERSIGGVLRQAWRADGEWRGFGQRRERGAHPGQGVRNAEKVANRRLIDRCGDSLVNFCLEQREAGFHSCM